MTLEQWITTAGENPEGLFADKSYTTYLPLDAKFTLASIAVRGDEESGIKPFLVEKDETGFATAGTREKMVFMLHVLLTFYYGVEDEATISAKAYDRIMSEGLLSRIERLASRNSDSRVKRYVCAIEDDFRAFEKMLNKEIANEVARINDPYKRIMGKIDADLTPEAMEGGVAELKEILSQIDAHKAKE